MSTTGANLGLIRDWALGTYFKDDMDANLKKLDRLYFPVLSTTTGTPPGSPTNGDRYIIPNNGGTGAWATRGGQIATYVVSAWEYDIPHDGMAVRDLATSELFVYDIIAGGSADGAWVSDGLADLKSAMFDIALVDMASNDYTMTDAESRAAVKVILNSGSGKTLTFPSTSDGTCPAIQLIYMGYAANPVIFTSETYAGTTTISAPDSDVIGYSTVGDIVSFYNDSIKDKVVGPASATDNAIARYNLTTGKLVQDSAATVSDDGIIRSSTNSAANPVSVPLCNWLMLTADYTLTNTTSEQKLFDSPANGTLTLPSGVYEFEAFIYITTMSASSGNAAFDPIGAGTAVADRFGYHISGSDNSGPLNSATRTGSSSVTQQSQASMLSAGVGVAMTAHIAGMFRISTGGTIIPSVSLVDAAAAVSKAGQYFKIKKVGETGETYVGAWT
jgi:hypothetical protein